MTAPRRHRRPALLDPASMDGFGVERLDPAVISQIAHESAEIIVRTGRASADPELTARLVHLVDEVGLDTLARLWAQAPARSLPGALWRLYVLREWVRRDGVGAARDFEAGIRYAELDVVVAGAASPPGPEQMAALAEAILRGVFEGDLAVALDRAAAFCRIVAAGRAARDGHGADLDGDIDLTDSPARSQALSQARSQARSQAQAHRAALVHTAGEDLASAAKAWRRGDLS